MSKNKYFSLVVAFYVFLQLSSLGSVTAQQLEKPYHNKLMQVEERLKTGDIPNALATLDEILKEYPDASEVHYAKALIYGQGRDLDTAIPSAKSAYELEKTNLLYSNYLMELYKSKGDFASAILLVDELIALNPSISQLRREKIMLLHTSKQSELALKSYDEAVEVLGESDTIDVLKAEILVDLKRLDEAKVILVKWQKQASPIRQVYSTLGYIYLQEQNPKQSVIVLQEGLKNSKDDLLYLDLADAMMASKKEVQAFDALKMAFKSDMVEYIDKHRVMQSVINGQNKLTLDQKQELANILVLKYPRIADSHVFKGDVLWIKTQLSEARSLFLTAVGINPRHVDAWRKLINVELSMSDFKSAIAHGQEAMHTNPSSAILTYFTGIAYMLDKDTAQAREYLEQALNLSTNENEFVQSMIYGSLGDLYHELKMFSASDVAYEEAIRLDEENVSALNNYAYYLSLRKQDLGTAAQHAKRANEIDPNSGTYQDTYAWVLFQQGNYPEALVWIEKAVRGSDVSAVLFEHYGDILMKNGREKDAIKQWEKALTLSSGDTEQNQKIKLKISEKKYID
ncbi:tetratricopeptide repeat protein [Sphingobacterium hungaricum]